MATKKGAKRTGGKRPLKGKARPPVVTFESTRDQKRRMLAAKRRKGLSWAIILRNAVEAELALHGMGPGWVPPRGEKPVDDEGDSEE